MDDEWDGLRFLGPKMFVLVTTLFHSASTFANTFGDEVEAQEVLTQLSNSAGIDIQHFVVEAARRVVDWSNAQQVAFKRRRRAVVADLEYSLSR